MRELREKLNNKIDKFKKNHKVDKVDSRFFATLIFHASFLEPISDNNTPLWSSSIEDDIYRISCIQDLLYHRWSSAHGRLLARRECEPTNLDQLCIEIDQLISESSNQIQATTTAITTNEKPNAQNDAIVIFSKHFASTLPADDFIQLGATNTALRSLLNKPDKNFFNTDHPLPNYLRINQYRRSLIDTHFPDFTSNLITMDGAKNLLPKEIWQLFLMMYNKLIYKQNRSPNKETTLDAMKSSIVAIQNFQYYDDQKLMTLLINDPTDYFLNNTSSNRLFTLLSSPSRSGFFFESFFEQLVCEDEIELLKKILDRLHSQRRAEILLAPSRNGMPNLFYNILFCTQTGANVIRFIEILKTTDELVELLSTSNDHDSITTAFEIAYRCIGRNQLKDILSELSGDQLTKLFILKNHRGETVIHQGYFVNKGVLDFVVHVLKNKLTDAQRHTILSVRDNADKLPIDYVRETCKELTERNQQLVANMNDYTIQNDTDRLSRAHEELADNRKVLSGIQQSLLPLLTVSTQAVPDVTNTAQESLALKTVANSTNSISHTQRTNEHRSPAIRWLERGFLDNRQKKPSDKALPDQELQDLNTSSAR